MDARSVREDVAGKIRNHVHEEIIGTFSIVQQQRSAELRRRQFGPGLDVQNKDKFVHIISISKIHLCHSSVAEESCVPYSGKVEECNKHQLERSPVRHLRKSNKDRFTV
ncbi:hypothetical protein Trydic_g32 [Trypoxylus dichotomus]